ncbi:MAG: ABC transporter permease [Lachnospiraceae bacterium]|nr:ABC transporter permease [Lachnospiraceae bacterium]
MKALSAVYYIKENKSRAAALIVLFMLTVLLFTAGNYIDSVYYYWEKTVEYGEQICMVGALSTDEDFRDYGHFIEELKKDDKLVVLDRSGRGFSGLDWTCTMGFDMDCGSVVFNTPEDLREAFAMMGIECDLSKVEDRTAIMSTALARQYDLKVGDTLDRNVSKSVSGSYKIAALTDDDSYLVFLVVRDDENLLRANVMSREMYGDELRAYLGEKGGDLKVKIPEESTQEGVYSMFGTFRLIFIAGIILLSVIHSITVNTVLTGQFIKRSYEFAIYRAIGLTKREVFRKCFREILTMDALGIVAGFAVTTLFTFLMNELYYIPKGQYLPYYSVIGLVAFLISNILVVLPGVISKSRSMSKTDITAY